MDLPPGRRVDLPGRGTTFVREIAGPPGAPTLILLHGLMATADLNWFPSFRHLGLRHHVVAMDHRGHGRGIRSARPFRLQDCADDVAALAHELGIERATLVGYSMGGPITLLTAKRHPDLVDAMVLCATSARFGERASAIHATAAASLIGASFAVRASPVPLRRRGMERVLRQRMSRGATPASDWAANEFRRSDPAMVMQAMAALATFDARSWLDELTAPAAVVATTMDRLVPPSRQLSLARRLDATVHEVPGDHAAGVVRPDLFLPAVDAALRSVSGRARRSPAPATS